LLLALAAPVRFGVPLAVALVAGLALPFALQDFDYVSVQYRQWFESVSQDDRTAFPLYGGLQDCHMLLRVVGVNLALDHYRLIQMATGGLVAIVIARQLWKGLHRGRVVAHGFTLGVCW